MKIDKSTLRDIVPMLQRKGTRFLLDLIPQIDRALEKSSGEAVLITRIFRLVASIILPAGLRRSTQRWSSQEDCP